MDRFSKVLSHLPPPEELEILPSKIVKKPKTRKRHKSDDTDFLLQPIDVCVTVGNRPQSADLRKEEYDDIDGYRMYKYRPKDPQLRFGKDSSDPEYELLHFSAILAKHGISYDLNEEKDKAGPKDAADRILDAMDQQLGDFMFSKSHADDVNDDPGTDLESVRSLRDRVMSDLAASNHRTPDKNQYSRDGRDTSSKMTFEKTYPGQRSASTSRYQQRASANASNNDDLPIATQKALASSLDRLTAEHSRSHQPSISSARAPSNVRRGRDNERLRDRKANGRSNLPRSNSVTSLSTVHTEEYEDKYRQMNVRHVAGVPVTSFDGVTIASDLDSVHTDAVRQHFKESLRKNKEKMSTSSADSVRQQVQDAKSLRDRYNKLKENDKKRNAAGKDLDVSYSTRPPLSRLKPSYNQNATYDEAPDHGREASKPPQVNDSMRSLDSVLSNNGMPADHNDSTASRHSAELTQQSADVAPSYRLSSKNSSRHNHTRSAGPSSRWNRSADSVDAYAARNRDMPDSVELSKSVPRRSYRGDGIESDAERHQLTSNALNKLKELDSQIDVIDNKKKASEQELKLMERTIEGHRISLLKLEEKLRENQAKADDARTELMVLEFKKEQCKKELDTTAKELNNAQERINDADDLGMTYDDIVALMQERDELRARVRRGEASKTTIAERQELERALHTAREELFRERKHKREQLEEMDEKLMEVEHNFESMEEQKKLEIAKLKEIIQNNGSEDKKAQSKAMERADAIEAEKKTLFDKIESLARQLQDKDREIVSLATESNRSREENQRLNDKVSELESKVAEQISLREKWIAESERNASSLRKEKELAVASIKGEKQSEIEKILQDLDKEKSRAILEAKSAHQEEICRIRSVVENKDTEIEKLRERLHKEEDAKRELANKLRMESQEEIRNVLQKERSDWEREKEVSEQRQEEMRKAKFEKEKSKLSSEVDEARNKCQMATEQISRLRTEIEELRLENRKQLQEKLDSVSHAREQERKDQAKKYEQLKTELTELNEAEMAVHRSKYNKLEEELRNAKQEKHDALLKCKDVSCQAERAERCFLAEIHEECLKMAELIRGIRTPSQSRNRSSAILSRSGSNLSRSNRPANTEGCVSQLRALGDDVRATLRDLTTEVETHRRAAQIAQRERNQVLSSGSNSSSKRLSYQIAELNGHNSQDMQALSKQLVDKDNELRDIQRNMSLWKDTTAQKLAEKFEEELAVQLDRKLTRHRLEHKRQLERMEEEISKLSASTNGHVSMHQDFDTSIVAPVSSTPSKAPLQGGATGEKGTVKLLRHLQGRVKQLRAENDLLRTNGQILDYEGLRKSR